MATLRRQERRWRGGRYTERKIELTDEDIHRDGGEEQKMEDVG
jgi:hypothetical protein